MPSLTVPNSRARRALSLSILALATLAACNPGAGAPPTPTTGPTGTPGSSASPTPNPTPTVAPSPTFGADQIEHATGAKDIVLRAEQGGGFVPFGFMVTQAPVFSLYGDGTVIFQQVDTRQGGAFGQAYLAWLVGHLDEEGVQALLRYAVSTGRLLNAKESYDDDHIADAPTTIFNLNAGGMQKVVNVYALSETSQPGPDAADRNGFGQLYALLSNFETQQGIGDVVAYDAQSYRVILMQGGGEPVGEVKAWPWQDLTEADFPAGDEPGGMAILDREHVAKLMEIPTGGDPDIWVNSPDGTTNVQFGVRPLLPEEIPAS